MKFQITFLLILLSTFAWSQKQKSIALHTNLHFYDYFNDISTNSLDVGFLSAVYQVQNKKRRWSYELAKFNISREEIGNTISIDQNLQVIPWPVLQVVTTQITGRIICSQDLTNNVKSIPYVGLGIQGIYASKSTIPFISNDYPKRTTIAGVTPQAQLGFKYNLNKHILLDAHSLFSLFALNYERESKANPALLHNQQKNDKLILRLLNQDYFFRLGVGFYL